MKRLAMLTLKSCSITRQAITQNTLFNKGKAIVTDNLCYNKLMEL